MGNPKAYLNIKRKEAGYRPIYERINDFSEIEQTLDQESRVLQSSRCIDCGVPFCHWGCPLESKIPEWQDALARDDWALASRILHSTNSFPEITGRVCPAPCEQACVLAISDEAVTIRENESSIIEKNFEWGLIQPQPPKQRTGKNIAIVGSGPAGLSAADVLNKFGHRVTVFERDDAIGGLLRYGIPDFKLSKHIIDRRIHIFNEEGIIFKTSINVGVDISKDELLEKYDAICIASGAMKPRDLEIDGRNLQGIYFAMDYLTQQNKLNAGQHIPDNERITAKDKQVLVIGGGDTGADCVGTAIRQKALSITQVEILPKPPEERDVNNPWPFWANTLRTSTSHTEGCTRKWSLSVKKFSGKNNRIQKTELVRVEWKKNEIGKWYLREIKDKTEVLQTDLVLLAMGFTQPIHEGLLNKLNITYDKHGKIWTDNNKTSIEKVFAAGDCTLGASLVVSAIHSGRRAALEIHDFLRNK